jgi:hypothetical protein
MKRLAATVSSLKKTLDIAIIVGLTCGCDNINERKKLKPAEAVIKGRRIREIKL